MNKRLGIVAVLFFSVLAMAFPVADVLELVALAPTKVVRTATRTAIRTPIRTSTPIRTGTRVSTSTPAPTSVGNAPYPLAPLCVGPHDNSKFHTLWNSDLRCHYNHEHGTNPFTEQVADTFPGFDLFALLGNVQVGHTNPSSPMENTHKHGGFKWQVTVPVPQACQIGFESAQTGVSAVVIQYHDFGDPAMELDARIHSALALLKLCRPGQDPGYLYTVQHIDYGQNVVPYQGDVMAYPNRPQPAFLSPLAPYISWDCVGQKSGGQLGACRESRQFILDRNLNTNSTWTSKSAYRVAPSGSALLALLFRVRDLQSVFDWSDQTHPFSFINICSSDSGATYNGAMPGCRWNNSTSTVHEIAGVIPTAWDNLAGFDIDPTVGRITATGYTTRFGILTLTCAAPGPDCHPIKMVRAFVGSYGAELSVGKVSNPTPQDTPERDIYFCGGVVCNETSAGAIPSGWIGSQN